MRGRTRNIQEGRREGVKGMEPRRQSDHLDSEERGEARLTRQGCCRGHVELSFLPHEIERRGILGMESTIGVSLAMWSYARGNRL